MTTTRRYVRLSEEEWAEAEAAWASGSASLPELSHRFGVSERGLQARFAKRGLVKGEAAKALAAQVVARVQAEQEAQADTLTERALTIREATYAHALKVERMIVASLDAAAADPAQTFAAAATIKMCANAASAFERLHTLKRSALGISDDDVNDDEMPVLVIRNLTDAQIMKLRNEQDEEDAFDGDATDDDHSPDVNEIVFEHDEAA